jgi:peptidoglycan/xylan/chitin deacetylase (PgdA/CDA1 family)
MHRKILTFLMILFSLLPFWGRGASLWAQSRKVEFDSPDINDRGEIILRVHYPSLTGDDYSALIRGSAQTLRSEALTLYPERSWYFPARNEYMIYNAYGCFSYDMTGGIWRENDFVPSFSGGTPLSILSRLPLEMSPDGRYALFVYEKEDGRASLRLFDRDRRVMMTVTSGLERDYTLPMAKWSPDSRYFIYRKGRDLYYFSMDQYLADRIPAETFRQTGFRDIRSAVWSSSNYLYVVRDRSLYRVHSSEFFTRSFYSDPFRSGSVWARLPLAFEPAFDSYSIDGEGRSIFLLKNGREGMVIPLASDSLTQAPVIYLSAESSVRESVWMPDGSLLLLVHGGTEKDRLMLYRGDKGGAFTELLQGDLNGLRTEGASGRYALIRDNALEIHLSTDDPKADLVIPFSGGLDFFWTRDGYIVSGSERSVFFSSNGKEKDTIALSRCDAAGFTPAGDLVVRSGGSWYGYDEALSWSLRGREPELRPARQSAGDYRIYQEKLTGSWYDTTLKVRLNSGFTTNDFIRLPTLYADLHTKDAAVPKSHPWYFDHGTRSEGRAVTLVFNGVDHAEGTADVLETLEAYGIRATFFLNGNFIHANPYLTKRISRSAHTVGSLFSTWFDMADPAYSIDTEFLKKGLARNEDDYFIATGKEMAMLWHTPYYYLDEDVLDVSSALQYIYIGTDLPHNDRPERLNPGRGPYDALNEARALLDRVKPGGIIALTLGRGPVQDEYLFSLLPYLIDELLRQGYEFVDLQRMMDTR